MAIHGKNTGVLLGKFDITSWLNEITPSNSLDAAEASHFGLNDKEYVAGLADGSVGFSGLFDANPDAIAEIVEDIIAQEGTPPITVGLGGILRGARTRMGLIKQTGFEIASPLSDVVSISGDTQCTGGLYGGVFLNAPVTLDASAALPSVDEGNATSVGGVLHLHVTANTRDSATTITLQDSTDNSVWVDVETFPAIAAGDEAGVALAVTGPIERYVRVNVTLAAGSGEITLITALSRR